MLDHTTAESGHRKLNPHLRAAAAAAQNTTTTPRAFSGIAIAIAHPAHGDSCLMDMTLRPNVYHSMSPQSSTPRPRGKYALPMVSPRTIQYWLSAPYARLTASHFVAKSWGQRDRWLSVRYMGKLVMTMLLLLHTSSAVYIDFENCLSPVIINSASEPQPLLQFQPEYVWASFNSTAPSHTLNITVYGNITGIATNESIPPSTDPQWNNPNETLGKILEEDPDNNKLSTFFARFNVLKYTPYQAEPSSFCDNTVHQQCPLIPAFDLEGNTYVLFQCPLSMKVWH